MVLVAQATLHLSVLLKEILVVVGPVPLILVVVKEAVVPL
jgi:hypothetical protein